MKLLDWLQRPAQSGIEGAVSDLVKLLILAVAGAGFNFLMAHFAGLSSGFLTSKRFAAYELAIWLLVTAAASIWITYSVMQRRVARVEREAEELSHLDPATGLLNLRAFKEQFPKAVEQTRQSRQPLTMIIFDIDGFKEVNALVGHDRANVILKGVASLLSPRSPDQGFRYPENVEPRSKRVIFRYGGDEFIILAFNTTVAGGTDPATGRKTFDGTTLAGRLQSNVWDMNFQALADKRRESGQPTRLTVSAGIADSMLYLDPDDTPEKLTGRAELALIEAKRLNAKRPTKDDEFRGTIVPWSVDLEGAA
jgi:diguanylate cyclase (GGDEF)-like protein